MHFRHRNMPIKVGNGLTIYSPEIVIGEPHLNLSIRQFVVFRSNILRKGDNLNSIYLISYG